MRNYGYTEEGYQRSIGDVHLWQRILAYCRQVAPGLFGAVILSLLITAAGLMLPRLMQIGIDNYITPDQLDIDLRIVGLRNIAFVYGALICTVFVCSFIQVILLEWIGQSLMQTVRQRLFVHIQTLDMAFFHEQRAGRLVTRLTNDVQNMHEMFTSVMVTLFNDALKLVGIYIFLFFMNRQLALVMTIFIPLAGILTYFFSRLARDVFRGIRSQLAHINAFLVETLASVSVIQIFANSKESCTRYRDLTAEYLRRNLRQVRLFGTFMPLTDLMSSSAVALILWYGGGEVLRSRLTLGELVAFLTYMRLFFQPLRELSQKYSIVQSAMASAERIFHLLDISPKITGGQRQCIARIEGDITFENLYFSYTPEEPVLKNINLKVRKGQTVALVGATGSGKSTLINMLARFNDPDQGSIRIGHADIREFPLEELRRAVGIIMQDIFILPDTVMANIILDQPKDEQRLKEILERTGLTSFINRLPQGLNTRIGEGETMLSVGEKQLLSFVRALYRDPAILVLDEATSSIDSESEALLENAMEAGTHGRTSLIIAHRLSTVRRADRIFVLEKGAVVEEGSHEQLMGRDSWYRKLVTMDMQANSA